MTTLKPSMVPSAARQLRILLQQQSQQHRHYQSSLGSCLRNPPQQQFHLTARRTYATARTKTRTTPRATPSPPPLASRRTRPSPYTTPPAQRSSGPRTPSPPAYLPASAAYAQTLAAKSSPTLLYLAPSSNTYMLTSYALSGFCISYGAVNFYTQIIAPVTTDLWWVIPVSIGGVSLLTAALGVRVALSARRLVKSVTAVPHTDGGVVLRLEARTLLPIFGRGKVVDVPVEQARLSRRIAPEQGKGGSNGAPVLSGFAARREAEQKLKREREYELSHLLSAPFRHFGRAIRGAVESLQRMVWRDGFVQIIVGEKGRQVWRVDAKTGWALDDGIALDRLIGPVGGNRK